MDYLFFALLVLVIILLNNISRRLRTLEKQFAPKEKTIPTQELNAPEPSKKPLPVRKERQIPAFEKRTYQVLKNIWNWICTGSNRPDQNLNNEYAVATTWLIRLGVLVLICSIGFFLKYSIDRNWTPPVVRVIGMSLTGLSLAGTGIWKRNSQYRPLAVALAGTGFVTLYLSIMTAFKMYHLIPAVPAFILMFLVTAGAATGALFTKAPAVALIGCAGGYLTPVFINTGSNNIPGLFLYLTILGAGTLIAARYRNWLILNISSFFLYAAVGAGALAARFPGNKEQALLILGLLALNYVIFGIQSTWASFKRDMTLWEFIPAVGNIIFFLTAGYPIAEKYYASVKCPAVLALFTALIAGVTLILICRNKQCRPQTLIIFKEIELVFALILTVPLLTGSFYLITVWSVMACLIACAAKRLNSRTMLIVSLLLFCAVAFAGADLCFEKNYSSYGNALYQRLLTSGVFILSLFIAGRQLKNLSRDTWLVLEMVSGLLFFCYSSSEVFKFWQEFLSSFRHGGLSVYWGILAFILLLTGLKKQMKCLRLCGFGLFAVTAGKIFFVDLANLEQLWRIVAFAVIGLFMLAGAVLYIRCKALFVPEGKEDTSA